MTKHELRLALSARGFQEVGDGSYIPNAALSTRGFSDVRGAWPRRNVGRIWSSRGRCDVTGSYHEIGMALDKYVPAEVR